MPSLYQLPSFAALSIPNDITTGVAIPKAHGHETTSTVAKTVIANEIDSWATSQPSNPEIIVVDVFPTMLQKVRNYFKNDNNIRIIEHDLSYAISSNLIAEEKGEKGEKDKEKHNLML